MTRYRAQSYTFHTLNNPNPLFPPFVGLKYYPYSKTEMNHVVNFGIHFSPRVYAS